jgi:hypothetical protein
MRVKAAAATALVALALGALPASAAQLDPRTAPVTTGPITDESDSYEGDRCSRQVIPSTNATEPAAVAKFCWTFYSFDPNAETDVARNYGAWWIQSIVKPKNGWCVSRVVTQLSMGAESTLHAISGRDFTTEKARRISPKIKIDAEGYADEPASIQQSLKLLPRKMTTRLARESNNLKIVWTGATRRAVASAGGVEGSWAASSGPPVFLPGMSPRMISDC